MKRRREKLGLVCHTRLKAILELDAEPRLYLIFMVVVAVVVVVSQAEAESDQFKKPLNVEGKTSL